MKMRDFFKVVAFFAVLFGVMCLPDLAVKYLPEWVLFLMMAGTFTGLIAALVWVVKQIAQD